MSDFKKGSTVKFKGYDADTPKDEQVLTKNGTYVVEEVEEGKDGITLVVRADNPDFDPDAPESKKNTKTILVDVFAEEVEEVAAKAGKKGKAEAESAPAKKGRTRPAKAAAKKASKKAEKAEGEEGPTAVEDTVLEKEDKEVKKMVEDADDILELAQELSEEGAALDYKLGGVLYHVRLDKAYEKVDKRYKENGGFGLYVQEQLNTEYRKAMYLIKIYVKANQFGIDPEKIAAIGWTKAAKIAAVMNADNADELVELAEESTVADLIDSIKESYKEVGRKAGERKKMVTFRFRVFEDQGDACARIIKGAAEQLGLKREDDAFEHIIVEWGVEHGLLKKKDIPARPVEETKPEKAKKTAKAAKPAKAAAKKATKAVAPPKGKRISPRRAATR